MEYVLDSSVLVKWFSSYNEGHRDKAMSLLNLYKEGKVDLYIPELAVCEISNALRYNKNFDENEVKTILKFFMNLELTTVNLNEEIIIKSLGISYEDNITVYDAIFIALSSILKIPLITANPKHLKAKTGRNIILLQEL
ncbi:MAG: type II toxin-antitoxin system VapC family toxin [Actinomycetota bacterium]|nr:type II toxin-antitoxin system VapC family toxin [Actinomycetota bacterium]